MKMKKCEISRNLISTRVAKNSNSGGALIALAAALAFTLLPASVMAITDSKTTTGTASPAPVNNGANEMNTGSANQAKRANVPSQTDGNINSKKQMEIDKNTPPSTPNGTNPRN